MEDTKKRNAVVLSLAILVTGLVAIAPTFSIVHAATPTSAPPVNLKTDNGSVGLVVDWSPKEIHSGKAVDFNISFHEPSSDTLLKHVNYNFEIKDASGNTVKSMTGQHTHNGQATQSVTFENAGKFQLLITVLGTGLTMPFDTSKSGTAETSIVVSS